MTQKEFNSLQIGDCVWWIGVHLITKGLPFAKKRIISNIEKIGRKRYCVYFKNDGYVNIGDTKESIFFTPQEIYTSHIKSIQKDINKLKSNLVRVKRFMREATSESGTDN